MENPVELALYVSPFVFNDTKIIQGRREGRKQKYKIHFFYSEAAFLDKL